MRGLLVEPSKLQQTIIGNICSFHGIELHVVASMADAKTRVSRHDYDLICTAYELPDGCGIELGHIVKWELQSQAPVVLLTSTDSREMLLNAASAGVSEVINRSNLAEFQVFLSNITNGQVLVIQQASKVLYVEDNKALALPIKSIIHSIGAEVEHCTTAEEAIELFDNNDFDVVLADIYLAGEKTGDDLVRHIRAVENNKNRVPVLMLSGQDSISRRVELLRMGANDYVSKPVVDEELVVRLTNLISQKKLLGQVELQREKLRSLAMTDQLTGLYNRHFLADVIPKRLKEAQRHQFDVSLILMDIDCFKAINDTYGHDAGDKVLREFAVIAKRSCRKEDIAIRLGGEEFAILLLHCNPCGAKAKAEEIRALCEAKTVDGISTTASFGVSSVHGGVYFEFFELFECVDKALYQAKDGGRNQVVYYPFKRK